MVMTLSTTGMDTWTDDPVTPAVRCIHRHLVALGEAARETRALLALCAESGRDGARSPATAARLADASAAVSTIVEAATRAAVSLDRALNELW